MIQLIRRTLYIFIPIIIFLSSHVLVAQDLSAITDSSFATKETFDISDMSRKSVELTLKARELVNKTLNNEELIALKDNNEKIINTFNTLLKPESFVKLSTLSDRNLIAKLNYWQMNLGIISNQSLDISTVFKKLNEGATSLKNEIEVWRNSDDILEVEALSKTIRLRLDNVEQMADSTINILNSKRTELLTLLDNITVLEIEIESLISKIENAISQKQEHILYSDKQSFFNMLFSSNTNWHLPESIWRYHANNFDFLIDYMSKNMDKLIIQLMLILALIVLFIRISKIKLIKTEDPGNIYITRLSIILSRPISAAFIIGLFASIVIYFYRPLLFQDITRFLVVFPIVIFLVKILPRTYHKYIYAFATMIILHIIYLNLPVTHILSRLFLFLIALIELVIFIHFMLFLNKTEQFKRSVKRTIQIVCSLLIVFSLLSLYGNIAGKVNLSFYFIEIIIGSFLIIVLITFSLVVVNGLTVLLIENRSSGKINFIKEYKRETEKVLISFFSFVAIIIMTYMLLGLFNIQNIVIDYLLDFFSKERSIGSIVFTWGHLIIFFFVIWLSVIIGRFSSLLLEGDVLNKFKMKKGLPHTVALMVKYTLVTVGVFVAVSAAGFPLDSLTVILGAFGVGIGFGLQNIFNNLVSGLILLFERPIQIGDTIEVGTMIGNVNSIGIRSSNIRTIEGAEIIVPNGNLVSNEVINWTLSDDRRRIEVIVGVSYNSDPHKVKEILLNILKAHEDIITNPMPIVLFQDLGESSLDFRMLFWTKEFNKWIHIKSEIIFSVFDKLKAAGIEIPFPQTDLHLKSVDSLITLNKND